MTIEELTANRRDLVETHYRNGFTSGINKLLSDLYPDKAHFIYELLQNAEDMNATYVRFILSENGLEFEHNGDKRDFTIEDIDAITNIGHNIQKRNDATSIGKFGVGFKSVFSYTSTPEIHSKTYHFRIQNYFVPVFENVPVISTMDKEKIYWTKFYLPFDNPNKPPKTAVSEIASTLFDLNENSLLFLSHIKKIEYMMPDSRIGYVYCNEENNQLTISYKPYDSDNESVIQFMRFQKEYEMIIDDSINKMVKVGIAYKLETNKDGGKRIVPIENGRTFIYFPTDKERSNLKFHINAPCIVYNKLDRKHLAMV